MSTTPQEFDWVKARAACTADTVFLQLAAGIEADINTRNAASSETQFAAALATGGKLLVIGETGQWARRERIRILPENGRIEVRDEARKFAISAEVFLNDEGRCKLRLDDGKELEQWQFRRMVLESYLFT
jgi:hypothetical protein